MKTKEEIAAEVAALEGMKPNVLRQSAFGDNHHDAIDAQIRVLNERLNETEIYALYGDEEADDFASNILDEALNARAWVRGNEVAPSELWAELIVGS